MKATDANNLREKAVGAMKAAVAKVVDEHARAGRPLAVWQDGKVAMVHPQETAAVHEKPEKYQPDNNRDSV